MADCPCGTLKDYSQCCGPYIDEDKIPENPESLMRSRYSAYTQAKIHYIEKTMKGKALLGFDAKEAFNWASQIQWKGLKLIRSFYDVENENCGYVEFKASYREAGKSKIIHELSRFQREGERWFYTDGSHSKPATALKKSVSRNGPCFCGSQKKYKNCHGKN